MNRNTQKRVLILASKLGYQTRGFAEAAERLGVEVRFGTDRCHQLENPWGDDALALHFENPQDAALEIARAFGGSAAGKKATDAASEGLNLQQFCRRLTQLFQFVERHQESGCYRKMV